MEDNKGLQLYQRTIISVIILTIVLSFVLLFVTKNTNNEILSILIGSISSIVLNYWHIKTTIKLTNNRSTKLKGFMVFSYTFRYLLTAIIIILSWLLGKLNPIYTCFGFALYPLLTLIMSLTLIKDKK